MRTIKYLMLSWVVLTLSMLLFSCMDDDFRKDTEQGDGKSIQLQISAPENTIVNPLTKAAQSNSQSVENLTILAFDNSGNILKAEYVTDGLSALGKTDEATILRNFTVGEGAKGFVCVVANAGDLGGIHNYSELEALRFSLSDGKNPQMIMFASKVNFNVEDSSYKVNAKLVRIYSMVTVVVQYKDMKDGITITPQTLTLYNVPTEGRLTEKNLITKEEESVRKGEVLDVNVQNTAANYWNYTSHEGGAVLFLYENWQPEGFCMTRADGKPDQTSKTPANFKQAITDTQLLMSDVRSSFIEIKANYAESTSSTTNGKITYRFFLGRDAYTNFDVSRNVHYKVTLTLTGNGGVDEATWRVETEDIPNKLNLSDIYVSYLAGSTSRLKITGDIEGIESAEVNLFENPNTDKDKGFTFAREGTGDEYVAVITAASTNVHYYKNKVGKLIFTMKNGTKLSTNIYQVPRLVDPIAIYKKATNVAETKIELKEYDENQKKYVVLESIGPWEVKIDGTSAGDWFELRTTDGSNQRIIPSDGNTISGEGKVEFIYQPLSPNTNPDTQTDGARYGKILIKYHNKWCEHEIFLRQGYQPTTLGNEAWSLFNCIGLDSNGTPQITEYPTQTGWLFKGGCNYGMHPFKPGFMEGINGQSKIKYSDEADKYENTDATRYDFTRMDDELKNHLWVNNSGPCPAGYAVADAYAYSTMVKNAYAYAGFVYDDDPITGWEYSAETGDAVILTTDNSCNPAKGIVFIEQNSTKNLFFGFGKGIVSGMSNIDPLLVNEIGVGHRYRGVEYGAFGQSTSSWGWLTVNDCNTQGQLTNGGPSYGGWYWNSTGFGSNGGVSTGGTHLGKVDFMYNLFSPTPFDIDVPTDSKDRGINVNSNASFVRCVVSSTKTIQIVAKFTGIEKYYSFVFANGTNSLYVECSVFVEGVLPANKNTLTVKTPNVIIKTGGGDVIKEVPVADLINPNVVINL